MVTATLLTAAEPAPAATQPRGALALALQEPFIVAIRLRANRPAAADAASFRTHIKQLLSSADYEARRLGYDPAYIKLAVYAFVAFLDESVLSSRQPIFSEWARQPLQQDVFGDNIAGETFFRHLDELLGRQDSPQLADLLEVFELCILLGFRGRYAAADPASLQTVVGAVSEKIRRIRGPRGDLSPAWRLPTDEALPPTRDPWIPRLLAVVAGTALLAFAIFAAAWLRLGSGSREIRMLVAELIR